MATGTFDIEQYQLELAQARKEYGVGDQLELDLHASVFNWDPALHPRDLFGKFREVLGDMRDGDTISMPGVKVKRTGKSGFIVDRAGEAVQVDNIENAADAALDASPKAKYKSKVNTIARVIRPFLTDALKMREESKRMEANKKILDVVIKQSAIAVSAKRKRDVLKAFGAVMADTYPASKSKVTAANERQIATWLVDKLFDKIEDLTTDQGIPLSDLNLSQWY